MMGILTVQAAYQIYIKTLYELQKEEILASEKMKEESASVPENKSQSL